MQYNIFQVMDEQGVKKHKGGCHCGQVRFEVIAPSQVTAVECSCGTCTKRQSRYFAVSTDQFRLLKGHGQLSTFGPLHAKHPFCTTCGVQSFFIPSAGQDDFVGVMPHCLDPGTMKKVKTEKRSSKKSALSRGSSK
ncbi:centromere protein V-like [Pollicipes pollicipes]|uniref:centromere protein V-like n=1 Tax=Pollicipes pollicipes TaxID=41117 RepID=UPI0018857E37|nr:centromere protein V-like [Pollicipes pollicipes]